MAKWWQFSFLVGILFLLAGNTFAMDYELTKIDEGTAWVSSYWGYNAPKLAYDGTHYYSVGYWGDDDAHSTLVVYQKTAKGWERGFTAEDAHYQPGM